MATLARTHLATKLFSAVRSTKYCKNVLCRGYAAAGDAEAKMPFTFAAANQVFYANKSVKQVDVPAFESAIGILPSHVPTLAVLRPGVVTVYEEDGSTKKIFVSSGTVTVNEDSSVQILAEEAHPLENLDKSAAEQALHEAEAQLNSAKTDAERAEAQIAVEAGQAVVAAVTGA